MASAIEVPVGTAHAAPQATMAPTPTPTRISGLNQEFVIHEHNGPSDGVHSVVRLLDACGGDQKLFEAAVAASTTISESSAKIWDDRSEREHAQAKGILALILEALPTVVGEFERAREKADKRREKAEAKADAKTGTIRVKKENFDKLLAEVNRLEEELRAMEKRSKKSSPIRKGKSTETSIEA
jgi:hypothetical protein